MRKSIARAVLIGLSLLSVALVAFVLYPFASALLFAAVLAGSLLHPTESLAGRLGGRRPLAAGMVTALVAVLIVIPASVLAVVLGREAIDAVSYVRATLASGGLPALAGQLPPSLRSLVEALHLPPDPVSVETLAQQQSGRAAAAVGGVLLATTNALVQIGAMLVAFYFLLLDGPRLVEWLAGTAPIGRARTYELLRDFRAVSAALLVSSAATAGVQTLVALVGFLLTGVPQPVFFALVTFIVAFVPMLGAASVSVALSGMLYLTGHPTQALVLLAWGLLFVGLSDNVVKPIMLRNRTEVHSAVIFFALIGGLAAFGIAGLVAGPLIVSFFLTTSRMCRRDLAPADEDDGASRAKYQARTA
jgi:predicted PurR-regulated permease PerM